jgi:hypothetical protein
MQMLLMRFFFRQASMLDICFNSVIIDNKIDFCPTSSWWTFTFNVSPFWSLICAQHIHQIWLKIIIMTLWLALAFTLLLGVIFITWKVKKFWSSRALGEKFIKQQSVTKMWRFYCSFIESILTFWFPIYCPS